jgi:hypothetical protein
MWIDDGSKSGKENFPCGLMMGVNQEKKISMSVCEALDTESLTYTVDKNPYLSKVLIRSQMKVF